MTRPFALVCAMLALFLATPLRAAALDDFARDV